MRRTTLSCLAALSCWFAGVVVVAAATEPPTALPDEILVQAAPATDGCVAAAFESTGYGPAAATPLAVALAERLRQLGAIAVVPVFRTPSEQARLVAGGPVTMARLLAHHRERLHPKGATRTRAVAQLAQTYRVRLADGVPRDTVLAALKHDAAVASASPNYLRRVSTQPDDRYLDADGDGRWSHGAWGQSYDDLWGLRAIGWDHVWRRQHELWADPDRIGGQGVVVAVLDTGIDVGHPDLADNVWRDEQGLAGVDLVDVDLQSFLDQGFEAVSGEDYEGVDREPEDHHGHGTHVAGIIAAVADNGVGIAGIAWRAHVMPVRVGFALAGNGTRYGLISDDAVAAGLLWAVEHGADVVNMSFGGGPSSAPVVAALTAARDAGIVLVAAAGNDDWSRLDFPGNQPGVIAVAAMDPAGAKNPYSNWGFGVDLTAPGGDILSLRAAGTAMTGADHVVGESYLRATGTSMATAYVSGIAALVRAASPELDPAAVLGRLGASTRPLDEVQDDGSRRWPLHLVDAERALVGPERPHFAVQVVDDLDRTPRATADGDRAVEPGEVVPFNLNVIDLGGPSRGRVAFDFAIDDPRVQVRHSAGPWLTLPWTTGTWKVAPLELSVASAVPRDLAVTLRVTARGDGVHQQLELPLQVNGPPMVMVVDDEYGDGVDTANTTPAVASDSSGSFVVAWILYDLAAEQHSVMVRRFDRRGAALGSDLVVQTGGARLSNPQIAAAGDGSFAVTWTSRSPGTSSVTFWVRGFDPAGFPRGEAVRVDDGATTPVDTPHIAATADGGYRAVWYEAHPSWRVVTRRLNPDGGGVGAPVEVARGSVSSPDIAVGVDGATVVTYRVAGARVEVATIALAAGGTPLGPPTTVSGTGCGVKVSPAIAADPEGGFWLAWDCAETFDTPAPILATHVDAAGRPEGPPRVVIPAVVDRHPFDLGISVSRGGDLAVAVSECLGAGALFGCVVNATRLDRDLDTVAGPVLVDHVDALIRPRLAPAGEGFALVWDEVGFYPDGIRARLDLFAPKDVAPRRGVRR